MQPRTTEFCGGDPQINNIRCATSSPARVSGLLSNNAPGGLHVSEDQFGFKRPDLVNGLYPVLSLTNNVDFRSDELDPSERTDRAIGSSSTTTVRIQAY